MKVVLLFCLVVYVQVNMAAFSAAVLGATGEVGEQIVRALQRSNEFTKIILVNRREVELVGPKLEQRVVGMNTPDELEANCKEILEGVDAAYMALGMGKASQAKNKEQLMFVDCDLPTAFARAAKEAGVRHMSLLSSVGADKSAQYSSFTGTNAGGGCVINPVLSFSAFSVFHVRFSLRLCFSQTFVTHTGGTAM